MALFENMASMALLGIAAFALFCFLLLVALYWNNERRQRVRRQQTRADIADLSILFQTMRDIITQQKTLAKQFNQELDKKMNLVKQVLARGIEKNEKLYERQQQLNQALDEAQQRLESLQRQIAFLRESVTGAPDKISPPPPQAQALPIASIPETTPDSPPRETAVSFNEETLTGDRGLPQTGAPLVFQEWDAPSFDDAPSMAPDEPMPVPETPGDAEAARKAFRTLLDLDASAAAQPVAQEALAHMPSPVPPAPPGAGGNGARFMAPLQKRVVEYSQAGMSVPEIARELGIGKGEVRLMLSLAKQSGRG